MQPPDKSGKRPTIGLVINELENTYHSELWPGVVDTAERHGINVIIFPGKSLDGPADYDRAQNIVYDLIDRQNVDGLVIATGSIGNFVSRESLSAFCSRFKSMPVTCIGVKVDDLPTVAVDNQAGMRELVNHFIDMHGARRIAFIRGPDGNFEAEQRFAAYRQTLEANDIEYDPEIVAIGTFESASARFITERWLKAGMELDALLCANDDMLLGAYDALVSHNVQVPDDLIIGGFDDVENVKLTAPPMTTVRQPLYRQAALATEMLLQAIDGQKNIQDNVLLTEMVVRHSCGCTSGSIGEIVGVVDDRTEPIDPDKLLSERAGVIINDTLEAMDNAGRSPDELKPRLHRLLLMLFKDAHNNGISTLFNMEIQNLLKQEMLAGRHPRYWRNLLETLRIRLLGEFRDNYETAKQIDYIIRKGQLLVADAVALRYEEQLLSIQNKTAKLRELTQSAEPDTRHLLKTVNAKLAELEIRRFYIVAYYSAKIEDKRDKLLHMSHLLFAHDIGKERIPEEKERTYLTCQLLPGGIGNGPERTTSLVLSLHMGTEQYGYIVADFSPRDPMLYEVFSEHISTTMARIALTTRLMDTQDELADIYRELGESNEKFEQQVQTDELTGLLSLTGFSQRGRQRLKAIAQGEVDNFTLFFVELKALSYIKDAFGRGEGENALKAVADMLHDVCGEGAVIGRISVDEFAALIDSGDSHFARQIKNRIDDYNTRSTKRYHLSINTGSLHSSDYPGLSFDELMSRADSVLYK